jgi:tRNA pseudouridine38-40 synthase
VRAFRLAYDGTAYHGFQRQPDVPTVEDALFDALRTLDVLGDGERTPEGYAAAGRTDRGVSAVAQTVAFDAPEWLTPRALNGGLSADVRAWASADASDGFHATHDASEREYSYHLHAPDASLSRAREGAAWLSGSHDYANLTPDDANTERTLDLSVERDGDYLVCRFRAGGFPRAFVRRAASLLGAVARDEADRERVERILNPEPLPGPEGVATAAPEPLVLTDVAYPSLSFGVDEVAARSAHEVFERRRVERETGARVAGTVVDGVATPDGEHDRPG